MEPLTESQVVAGRYRLGAVIGRGGMAEVRTAEDLRLGRSVAVKLLRTELAEQAGIRKRFEDEARSAARLSHANVVSVYDTGEHEGVPYIVMERLPGTTLADLIERGALNVDKARRIGIEVLDALGAAHSAGLIHRDIKPANVLLASDGTAKVADFGIAKSAEAQTHTSTGMLLGTAAYLPPERLAGHQATLESDLYAVGVLLYEAVTGSRPFSGDTPIVMASAIQRGTPRPVRALRPDLDPSLAEVIERAMMANPYDRFRSASDMAEALDGTPLGAADPVPPTTQVDHGDLTKDKLTERLAHPTAEQGPGAGADHPVVRPKVALFLVVLALALVVALVMVVSENNGTGAENDAPPAAVDERIPELLDRALRELEEAIRP